MGLANFSDLSWGLREDKTAQSKKGEQTSDSPGILFRASRFGIVLMYIAMNAVASYFLYSPELTALVYLFTVGVVVLLVRFVFMFLFLANFRLPLFNSSKAGYQQV